MSAAKKKDDTPADEPVTSVQAHFSTYSDVTEKSDTDFPLGRQVEQTLGTPREDK